MSEQDEKKSMDSTPSEIILDLGEIRDATKITDKNYILNQDLLSSFTNQIKEFNKKAKDYRNNLIEETTKLKNHGCNDVFERVHRTITISGGRGSGKTSFLLSAFYSLQQEYKDGGTEDCPEILDILDPTLIEQKDHLFVNIISRIKQRIDAKMRNSDNPEGEYKDWLDSLKNLAEGLPMLDGVAGQHGPIDSCWADSLFVMEKGLRQVKAANQLEQNFHLFIYKSLAFLKKSSFVLAFDDIDLNFTIGWQLLETIRKYLTSPQIITIIAGDLGLYSMMIRKHQSENFNKIQLEHDGKQKEGNLFEDMVDHLETQYLLKVLRVEYRYLLLNMLEISRTHPLSVVYNDKYGTENKMISWQDYCTNFFKEEWNLYFLEDISNYERTLISNPLRCVLQVLNGYERNPKQLTNILFDVFFDDLISMNFPVERLKSPNPDLFINFITVGLAKNGLIQDGYRLKPEFENDRINNTLMVLSLVLLKHIPDYPHLILEIMLKLGLTREYDLHFVDYFSEYSSSTKSPRNYPNTLNYISFVGINSGEDLVHVIWMSCGYFRSALRYFSKNSDSPISFYGSILLGENYRELISSHKSEKEKELEFKEWQNIFFLLPVAEFTDYANRENECTIFSILPLLAILGEILKIQSIVNKNYNDNATRINEEKCEIRALLRKFTQIRNFPFPNWDGNDADESPSNGLGLADTDGEWIDIDSNGLDLFIDIIIQWMNLFRNFDFSLPIHVYSRISARFFSDLHKIDNSDYLFQHAPLGKRMHRMIIAFMNSVLVEEALCRLQKSSVNISLSSPIISDRIFRKNLTSLKEERDLTFAKWVISCPLLLAYLKYDKQSYHSIMMESFFNPTDQQISTTDFEKYTEALDSFLSNANQFKVNEVNGVYNILNTINFSNQEKKQK